MNQLHPGASRPPPRQRHIVVAEDDVETRRLVAWVLAVDGFRVTEVGDGRELLDLLFEPHDPIDLVISDVHMPRLSGLDVLDACRTNDRLVPTLLMTAYDDDYTRSAAHQFGALGVIDKPLDLDDLRLVVSLVTTGRKRP